jgi:hypothetical protein
VVSRPLPVDLTQLDRRIPSCAGDPAAYSWVDQRWTLAVVASVLRLIIPDMESWFLRDFAADEARLGPRALRYLAQAPA